MSDPTCRLVILVSGSGSNLQSFIDKCADGVIDCRIALVLSNRAEAYGLSRAQEAGIATAVVPHQDFADRASFDAALMEVIDRETPDLVILAGFMRILTPAFVQHYAGRLLNIHPSLLPKYPGLRTHRRALDAGEREHGTTVHFVTEELDGGPAIIQARVPVREHDTEDSLAARVLQKEHEIYPLAAQWFAEGRLQLGEQGALLDGKLLPPQGYQYEANWSA